jgi:hypothetical protein
MLLIFGLYAQVKGSLSASASFRAHSWCSVAVVSCAHLRLCHLEPAYLRLRPLAVSSTL